MNYSITQLQKMLEEKSTRLTELSSLRKTKVSELQEIDSEIEQLSGEPANESISHVSVPKRQPGTKKKKSSTRKTALDYAREVLGRNSGGLELEDLADKIVKAGYESKSDNFKNTLYQALYKARDEFPKNGDGKYTLK
jgi:hypothetical protein